MSEVLIERTGKIPVVGRTYKITEDKIEYESVNKEFEAELDGLKMVDSNYRTKKVSLQEPNGEVTTIKLEDEAKSVLMKHIETA